MSSIIFDDFGSTGPAILNAIANSIGGTPRHNINTTYHDSTNTYVANDVVFAGSVTSTYVAANPLALTDSDIWNIVRNAFTARGMAVDIGLGALPEAADTARTSLATP